MTETINGDGVAVAANGVGKTFDTRSGEVQALTGVDLRVAAGEPGRIDRLRKNTWPAASASMIGIP